MFRLLRRQPIVPDLVDEPHRLAIDLQVSGMLRKAREVVGDAVEKVIGGFDVMSAFVDNCDFEILLLRDGQQNTFKQTGLPIAPDAFARELPPTAEKAIDARGFGQAKMPTDNFRIAIIVSADEWIIGRGDVTQLIGFDTFGIISIGEAKGIPLMPSLGGSPGCSVPRMIKGEE